MWELSTFPSSALIKIGCIFSGIRKFDDYVNLFQLTPSFRNRSSCNRTGSAITCKFYFDC